MEAAGFSGGLAHPEVIVTYRSRHTVPLQGDFSRRIGHVEQFASLFSVNLVASQRTNETSTVPRATGPRTLGPTLGPIL